MGILDFSQELGGLLLSFCALPQLYHVIRHKTTAGISTGFLLMWGGGELFVSIALIGQGKMLSFFFLNYVLNFAIACVILYMKGRHRYAQKKIQKNKSNN